MQFDLLTMSCDPHELLYGKPGSLEYYRHFEFLCFLEGCVSTVLMCVLCTKLMQNSLKGNRKSRSVDGPDGHHSISSRKENEFSGNPQRIRSSSSGEGVNVGSGEEVTQM